MMETTVDLEDLGIENWRDMAECQFRPEVDMFPFLEDSEGQTAAKALCEECPVTEDCLDYAMTTKQEFGVWGGLNEEDRKKFRRRLRSVKV